MYELRNRTVASLASEDRLVFFGILLKVGARSRQICLATLGWIFSVQKWGAAKSY